MNASLKRYVVRHSVTYGYYVYDSRRGAPCASFPTVDRSSAAQYAQALAWIRENFRKPW